MPEGRCNVTATKSIKVYNIYALGEIGPAAAAAVPELATETDTDELSDALDDANAHVGARSCTVRGGGASSARV